MTTLVLVGNAKQPFQRLLDAVVQIVPALPKPVIVQHGNTWFQDSRCECHTFLDRDQIAQIMSNCAVVICHAGAGAVLDAVRAGLAPVVLARKQSLGEHIDDHQSEFAAALAKSGKVVVVRDASELGVGVARALSQGRRSTDQVASPPLVAMLRETLRAVEMTDKSSAR